MKRLLASAVTAALALGGLAVATAAPASAHDNGVQADCDVLHVNLTNYSAGGTNTVTVTVDGNVLEDAFVFGDAFTDDYSYDGGTAHTWSVDVEAWDGDQFDVHTGTMTTTACPPTTPPEPVKDAQVGVYVYPKLDSEQPASWDNSGKQGIVTSKSVKTPKNPAKKKWLVSPLDLDAVRTVAQTIQPDVTDAQLCSEWGVQQDLVGLTKKEYKLPEVIEKSSSTGIFPEGSLLGDDHQDLGALLGEGACDAPPAPSVTPEAPTALLTCDAETPDVTLPASTEAVSYELTEDGGVRAVLKGDTAFATENLGGYVVQEDGKSAVLPAEAIEPTAEDCDLVPGDIVAVCQGDVPFLGYGLALPEGYTTDDENPVTITFVAPEGEEDYVLEDQPLSGSVLWPGASDAEPQQWPGWELKDDGTYVETDGNFAWTRAGVTVKFEVNPSYTTTVEYPAATTECANPPQATAVSDVSDTASPEVTVDATDVSDDTLASTGATVAGAVGLAVLLIGGGALVIWLRRRVQA